MKLIQSICLTSYLFLSKLIAFGVGYTHARLSCKATIRYQSGRSSKKAGGLLLQSIVTVFFFANFFFLSFLFRFSLMSSFALNLLDMMCLVFAHRSNIIGLTGGIACGKTSLAELLESNGAIVIDADKISKEVVKSPAVLKRIYAEFGDGVFNEKGELDRAALGAAVFGDRKKKKILESITHPRTLFRILSQMLYYKILKRQPLVVVDAPLLFQSKFLEYLLFPIIVIHTRDREQQLERLQKRDKKGRADAENRINSQMPLETKKEKGDILVDNSGPYEALQSMVIEYLIPALSAI